MISSNHSRKKWRRSSRQQLLDMKGQPIPSIEHSSLDGDKLVVIPGGQRVILAYTLGSPNPTAEYKIPIDKDAWHYSIIELTQNSVSFIDDSSDGLRRYNFEGKLLDSVACQSGLAKLPVSSNLSEYWVPQWKNGKSIFAPGLEESPGIPAPSNHTHLCHINKTTVYLVNDKSLELYDRKSCRLLRRIPLRFKVTHMIADSHYLYLGGNSIVDIYRGAAEGIFHTCLYVDGVLAAVARCGEGSRLLTYSKSSGLTEYSGSP